MTVPPGTGQPAYLIDERWGVAHRLEGECTRIGREASNRIIVRDLAVSRFHAEVRQTGNQHVVHALGSTETKVNGRPLAGSCPLAEGDVIEIVYTRLRFTTQPLPRSVMLAPDQATVDQALAGEKTQFREIVSTKRLRQLRRPVKKPFWLVVILIVGGGVILGVLIQRVVDR
jgi:hypothetical protein